MPATNPFRATSVKANDPANDAFVITPDDDNDLATIARAIYVGGEGDLQVTTRGGTTLTFTGLPAGTFLPLFVTRVHADETDATNLIGLI